MVKAGEIVSEAISKPFGVIYDLLPALPFEFGFNLPVPRFVARKAYTEKLERKRLKAEEKIVLKRLKKGLPPLPPSYPGTYYTETPVTWG